MVQPQTIITKSPQETSRLGEELAHSLRTQDRESIDQDVKRGLGRGATIICLYGELGSGKTTFAQGFAKGLGIQNRLLSPTFIIVRRYNLVKGFGFLYHIDLYRLQKQEEIEALGISEFLKDSNSYVLIEWAEKMESILPNNRIDVRLKVQNNGTHEITTKKF